MMVWAAPLDYDWTYRLKQACIKTKQKKTKHSQQVKTILGDHLVFEVKLPRTTGTEGGREGGDFWFLGTAPSVVFWSTGTSSADTHDLV